MTNPSLSLHHVTRDEARRAAAVADLLRTPPARLGWDDEADRINRWTTAGEIGHWTDPEYDTSSPCDGDQP